MMKMITPLLLLGATLATGQYANAEVRMFMTTDGTQHGVPSSGNTTLFMTAGTIAEIKVWLDDPVATADQVGGYQVLLPINATLLASTGQVSYVDEDGFGDSIFIDTSREDWIFANDFDFASPPVYTEHPAQEGLFGMWNRTLPGLHDPILLGVRYMFEFRIQASADANGLFELAFHTVPPQTSVTNIYGAEHVIDEMQALTIVVGEQCSTAACSDLDGDGIRDNGCLWWTCAGSICDGTAVGFGDLGGQFGTCAPDGTADNNDRNHALNCFANVNTDGSSPYGCEPNSPQAFNVDAGGPFGDCNPDGVCDGNDAFHVLDAFGGTTNCSCPLDSDGPMPEHPQHYKGTVSANLALVAERQRVRPGDEFQVIATLNSPVRALRGYQLHTRVSGGAAGALELVDIAIDDRPGHVFSQGADWRAFNLHTAQMLSGLDTAGIDATAGGYLATFTYRASTQARGTFTIDLLHDARDDAQRTFLFAAREYPAVVVKRSTPAVIRVRDH